MLSLLTTLVVYDLRVCSHKIHFISTIHFAIASLYHVQCIMRYIGFGRKYPVQMINMFW